MQRRLFPVLVIAVALASACKKTEEGESKQWDRSLQQVGELSATYPGFKNALEEAKTTAQKAMDAAKGVGDKEQRIKAMAAANRLLSGGFVGNLRGADDRIKALRKQLVDLAGSASTDEERRALSEAKRQVEKTLSDVDSALRRGAGDAAAAAAILAKAGKDLDFAKSTLAQVSQQISSRKSADKAQVDKASADQKAADDAEKAKTAPWTCEYCQHENAHDAAKCGNCGADRPVAAAP